jgi:hypothetical protein
VGEGLERCTGAAQGLSDNPPGGTPCNPRKGVKVVVSHGADIAKAPAGAWLYKARRSTSLAARSPRLCSTLLRLLPRCLLALPRQPTCYSQLGSLA